MSFTVIFTQSEYSEYQCVLELLMYLVLHVCMFKATIKLISLLSFPQRMKIIVTV